MLRAFQGIVLLQRNDDHAGVFTPIDDQRFETLRNLIEVMLDIFSEIGQGGR